MRRPDGRMIFASLFAVLAASGCALTDKATPISPRYFTPEGAPEPTKPSSATRLGGSTPVGELRLGRVVTSSYLDDRVVYRDSEHESGYYLERRWTESPEQYLRRRLSHVLFEERGVRQVVGGSALTLDVELTAFDDVRQPAHSGRVQVIVWLRDERAVRWEETLRVEEAVAATTAKGDTASATVEALGRALRTVVDRISDRVMAELASAASASAAAAASPAPPPPPPPVRSPSR